MSELPVLEQRIKQRIQHLKNNIHPAHNPIYTAEKQHVATIWQHTVLVTIRQVFRHAMLPDSLHIISCLYI